MPKALLKTNHGEIEITLFEDESPNTVANFVSLVEKKFYDGLTFHRIEPNFCIQGGDPKGDGSGGPGYRVPPEFPDMYHKNEFLTVAMAKSQQFYEMSGSQFYININKEPKGNAHLDHVHTVFGKVTKGQDVVEKIAAEKTANAKPASPVVIVSATMVSKRDHAYAPTGLVPDEEEKKQNEAKSAEKPAEAKTEAKTEPAKTEAKTEPAKTEAKTEPAKTEPAKTEPAKPAEGETKK
ncbi:MAG: peptidylprolyl isomerase [Planctomycetota bacterium]|nr:peptidylprolyl isomerase [Planctomycetota bacterium]